MAFFKRPSGHSQFSVPLAPLSMNRRVDELRQFVTEHVAEPLTVADLAGRIHVSDRQLTRVFKSDLGMTPASYIQAARGEVARNRPETTDDTLERVAALSGLNTVDTLTRAFRRTLTVTPTGYRNRFRLGG